MKKTNKCIHCGKPLGKNNKSGICSNCQKDKKIIDKKENKYRRIATRISLMDEGETISPSNLFRSIEKMGIGNNIHPNTGRDLLDLHDSLNKVGFKVLRDKDDKIKLIVKTSNKKIEEEDIKYLKEKIDKIYDLLKR